MQLELKRLQIDIQHFIYGQRFLYFQEAQIEGELDFNYSWE